MTFCGGMKTASSSCLALLFGRRLLTTQLLGRPCVLHSRIGAPWRLRSRQATDSSGSSLFSTMTSGDSATMSSPRRRFISFLTDLEGDKEYLDRFIRHSQVLEFRSTTPRYDKDDNNYFPYNHCIEFVSSTAPEESSSVLVYGGDVWDRGGNDLYVIRQLLDLRQRYPDRVYFIMGNRDINKMRVLPELGISSSSPMPYHGGVYWLRGTGRVGDPSLRHDNEEQDAGVSQTSAPERLEWMLSRTMGSPKAFELRRRELQTEREQQQQQQPGESSVQVVTDDDVVESYRRSCHPTTGEMGKYLSQAQLALKLGNVLFVHGALPLTREVLQRACVEDDTANFWKRLDFAVPWLSESKDVPDSVSAWLERLNEFAQKHVEAWRENVEHLERSSDHGATATGPVWSTRGGYHRQTPGTSYGDLMQYGMGWTPDGKRNPTIVYSSWMDNGLPRQFFPDAEGEDAMFAQLTAKFFEVAGLDLIASGHQPHGDMPTPIRIADAQWILCCDTNYAGDTVWMDGEKDEAMQKRTDIVRGVGGRGDATVSEVLIEQCTETGSVLGVRCHGVLSNELPYDTSIIPNDDTGQNAPLELIPQQGREKDWWIKSKFDDGSFLISSGEGYQVWNCLVGSKS